MTLPLIESTLFIGIVGGRLVFCNEGGRSLADLLDRFNAFFYVLIPQ